MKYLKLFPVTLYLRIINWQGGRDRWFSAFRPWNPAWWPSRFHVKLICSITYWWFILINNATHIDNKRLSFQISSQQMSETITLTTTICRDNFNIFEIFCPKLESSRLCYICHSCIPFIFQSDIWCPSFKLIIICRTFEVPKMSWWTMTYGSKWK